MYALIFSTNNQDTNVTLFENKGEAFRSMEDLFWTNLESLGFEFNGHEIVDRSGNSVKATIMDDWAVIDENEALFEWDIVAC